MSNDTVALCIKQFPDRFAGVAVVKKESEDIYVYDRQGKARQGVVELAYEVTHPVEEERDTPGLIFVGGWGESAQTWRQQVAFFAPRFPTLIYDRRGLGR